jgi:hypothetical protein
MSQEVDKTLASLGLLEIARRCLIDGEPLEAAGEAGPYGTCSQQRAWAAGRLTAACHAIHFAEQLEDQRKATSDRIAQLEKALAYARAETRAAARFHTINVPFREKRKTKSVDWDAA